MEENIINRIHELIKRGDSSLTESEIHEAVNFVRDLPNQLNIINVPKEVFENSPVKQLFEDLFRSFDSQARFIYLPSFRRVRVVFSNSETAFLARVKTPGWTPNGYDQQNGIKSFFVQFVIKKPKEHIASETDLDIVETIPQEDGFLKLPQQTRLFLLSPPASPPVGWAPRVEAEPVVSNFELFAALANLQPNTSHELHPSSQDEVQPSIILTTADASDNENQPKVSLQRTRCPDR
ncbi:hypothetical protein Ciccas_000031 [Cichlidogyrus casuarinus]|uniref:Uncharacterized protein n=1 Tax=Cichlidogyrus casuarinus TaxID=1844966 RepID=A0ABD2QP94_9PLAT